MKKPKIVKPFFFKDHLHQEICDQLNIDHPINLKYNQKLVNRIYARYPLISKTELSTIVKFIFESIRDLMVLGKVLNFNNLFFDTKFHFFTYRKNKRILPALKVKISTPPPMRKHD
jgi:nucleoid DNA-binding protein